jgi:hypothetical protein
MNIQHIKQNKKLSSDLYFVSLTEDQALMLIRTLTNQLCRGSTGNSGREDFNLDTGGTISFCVLKNCYYYTDKEVLHNIVGGAVPEGTYTAAEWDALFIPSIRHGTLKFVNGVLFDKNKKKFSVIGKMGNRGVEIVVQKIKTVGVTYQR